MVDSLIKAGKLFVDKVQEVFEAAGNVDGLTEKNLKAFLENKGVSELLNYRYYEEDENGIGIYTMADGRKGFILRINAPVFVTDLTEMSIISLFESITVNGAVLQLFTFSSQNINRQIDDFVKFHSAKPDVKNREILHEVIQKRAHYLKKWARESMFDLMEYKLRDYVNIVSVLYPKGVDEDFIKREFLNIKEILKDFSPQNFRADKFVTLLREFFHNEKEPEFWENAYDSMKALNSQIVSGGVDIKLNHPEWKKGYVINDKNYVATLTTKQFPQSISAEEFTQFFYDKFGQEIKVPIYGPFFVSLTILFEDIDKLKEETFAKLRHDLGELRKFDMKTIEARPELKERLEEVRLQLKFMSTQGETPLKAMWSMTLFDTDKKRLTQSISSIKSKFKVKNWYLTEELFPNIALFETLFSLPLQFSYTIADLLKRFDLLFKSNNAAIAPLIGDFRGFGYGHMPLFGRSGQLQWYSPFAKGAGNYNVAAIGMSGEGKSFTFNDLSLMMLTSGVMVRIIDSLPSYKRLTHFVGGVYEDFSNEKELCLNFFTNILTKRDEKTGEEILVKDKDGREYPVIAEEEMATIIPMIALMAGVEGVVVYSKSENAATINDSADARFLAASFEEAIVMAFRAKGRNAGMFDVWNNLIQMRDKYKQEGYERQASLLASVVAGLKQFSSPDGLYYHYFNGVNNFKLEGDFAVAELTALEKKGIIYPIVMMAIANSIVNEFYEDLSRKKMLIIDEFWRYKDNLIVATFTEELARKVRKASGSLVTITQNYDEYNSNSRMKAIWNNSGWKFVLGKQNIETGLGSFADRLLRTISAHPPLFGEVGIFNTKAMSISRLKVDPLSEWLYRTDDEAQEAIANVKKQFGLDELNAARFLAYKQENPTATPHQILKEIGVLEEEEIEKEKIKKTKRKKMVLEMLKDAIEIEDVKLFKIPIVNEEKFIERYEIISKLINDETGEEIGVGEIFEYLREDNQEELIKKYDEVVVKKAVQFSTLQNSIFHVNISLEAFLDSTFINKIIDYVNEFKAQNNIFIEVMLKNVEEKDEHKVHEIIKKLKEYGIGVFNDNIDIDVSYAKALKFNIDGLKIDSSVVKNILNDKKLLDFLRVMLLIAQNNNLDIVFVNVSSEEIFETCLEIGGRWFEGYLFGEPELLK